MTRPKVSHKPDVLTYWTLAVIVAVIVGLWSPIIPPIMRSLSAPQNYRIAYSEHRSGEYEVKLNNQAFPNLKGVEREKAVDRMAWDLALRYNGEVIHVSAYSWKGFSIRLPHKDQAYEICTLPEVEFVEETSNIPINRYWLDYLEVPESPFTWLRAMWLIGLSRPHF